MNVILTTGSEDVARASFGLDAAISAAASGFETLVFLTLNASEWACESFDTELYREIDERIASLLAMGVTMTCCSNCAVEHCANDAQRHARSTAVQAAATRPGIDGIGLTTLMKTLAQGGSTVTF